MAVNLSPIWGAGAQLFDNSGNVLSGGKIYTYAAGTTTPATTYTSSNGITANSNPIILNSAGRVPYEIWLSDTLFYKFVLKDSNDTLIATYDNLVGINSNYIAYTAQQEIQTATAGQTVFNLATMQYIPGTNNLSVFVDGVNQYGPGAQYAYVETDTDTVTFVNGLHVGASVKFTTASPVSSTSTDAANVSYNQGGPGAVTTTVESKLQEIVMRTDFDTETDYLDAAADLSTGGFWMDELPQPRQWRFADRVFIGAAASETNGNKYQGTPPTGTFLTTQMGAFWMERGATTLSVAPFGDFGGTFAARTSDKAGTGYYGTATIGILGVVENDDSSVNQTIGWAGYFEANRGTNNKVVYGLEISVKNKGSNATSSPYSVNFASTGIWMPAGGDASYNGVNANPCTTAIMIGRGDDQGDPALPMTWNKGIIFNADGITGTDGVTGTGIAIEMAKGHVVNWAISTGQSGAAIRSDVDTYASRQGIIFANDQTQFTTGGSFTALIGKGSGTDNQVRIFSSVAGSAPQIQAGGSDTNIDLQLVTKGTGYVQFGNRTGTGDAPITGYIEIKDNGGTVRKLAVIS